MKKLILCIFIVYSPMLRAQVNEYMPVGTKLWYRTYEITMSGPSGEGYNLYESVRDTMINDTTARIVQIKNCPSYLNFSPNENSVCTTTIGFYIRNNGTKIEYRYLDSTKWYLYFDKSWKKDSTYKVFYQRYYLLSKDTTLEVKVINTGIITISGAEFKFTDIKIKSYTHIYYADSVVRFIDNAGYRGDYFPRIIPKKYLGLIDGDVYESLSCFQTNDILYTTSNQPCDTIILPHPWPPYGTVDGINLDTKVPVQLVVAPNPVKESITLLLLQQVLLNDVGLYDAVGSEVKVNIIKQADDNYHITFPKLPPGIYCLKINYQTGAIKHLQYLKIMIDE